MFECDYCDLIVLRVCEVRKNFYLYFAHKSSKNYDSVYDYLLESMGEIQSADFGLGNV